MTNILRPGILVSLKTTLTGGVLYNQIELEKEHELETGTVVKRWETERKITDKDEYERATKVRSAASALVRSVCAKTAFGLLCPESAEQKLDEAVEEARKLCATFNADATVCRIGLYVLKGRIATTDQEAASAVASEVRELIEEMDAGIKGADPKVIREAANRAKQLAAVLDETKQAQVSVAVDSARKAAREIVQRVEKQGENAEKVIAELAKERAAVEMTRFAFLDLDDGPPLAKSGSELPAVSAQRAAALDVGE